MSPETSVKSVTYTRGGVPARRRLRLRIWRNSLSRAVRLASSTFRLGTTTMSNPPTGLLRRKTSRISRLALFLWTAPPSFRVAATPSRPYVRSVGSANNVKSRPWTLMPRSYTSRYSDRRRMRSSRLKPATSPRAALLAADCETLAALRTSPLQNQAAVLGAHTDQKPVCTCASTGIGLKSALSLHRIPLLQKRTVNVSQPLPKVSTRSDCVRVGVLH